jgi:putative hydrolase of the HAD superfamily
VDSRQRNDRPRTALIVDYAGVMTTPYQDSLHAWMLADGLDPVLCTGFMRALAQRSVDEVEGPMHGLEIGTWSAADFELAITAEMADAGLGAVDPEGLLARMFGGLRPDEAMTDLVGKARAAGIRTALLSNSFGLEYPREDWDRLFDLTVISGEVGLRKPDAAIYRMTCERLGVDPRDAVFVDDMSPNVDAADALGMIGILHRDTASTAPQLERLLGVPLR